MWYQMINGRNNYYGPDDQKVNLRDKNEAISLESFPFNSTDYE